MIDEKRIILMTKLSMYEKDNIKKDLKIMQYDPQDYVYMNNLKTIISVFIVSVLIVVGHVFMSWHEMMLIPVSGQEVFEFYVLPYGTAIGIVLILYTLLSTTIYLKRYKEARKRVKGYKSVLNRLEKIDKEVEIELEMERGKYRGKRKFFTNQRKNDYNL